MNIKFPYFIYTSGEKGMHGLDWGVKFVSSSWGSPADTDLLYRTLTERYGLRPSLERPNDGESGFLILPVSKGSFQGYLFGMVQPYRDSDAQGNRPNISLIACLLSQSLVREFGITPGQVGSTLLQQESLKTLGFRQEERHPDFSERPPYIELDVSSISAMPKGFLKLNNWPHGSTGVWLLGDSVRKLSPAQIEKVKEDQSHPGRDPKVFNISELKTKWIIGVGLSAFIAVLFLIFSNGNEQKIVKPDKKDRIVNLKSTPKGPARAERKKAMKKEEPATASTGSLLDIFAPADRETFELVALLNRTQVKALVNGGWVAGIKISPLVEKKTEKETLTLKSMGQSTEGFLVTTDVISCLLGNMVEEWSLQKKSGTQKYHLFEIRSKNLRIESERLRSISSNIEKCGGLKTAQLVGKGTNPDTNLRSALNKYLLDQRKDKGASDWRNQIAFFCPTTKEGVFRGYYVEYDDTGRERANSTILVSDRPFKGTNARKLSDCMGKLFKSSDAERPELLKITNKKINNDLIKEMNNPRTEQKNSPELDQDPRVLKFLSELIIKKLN